MRGGEAVVCGGGKKAVARTYYDISKVETNSAKKRQTATVRFQKFDRTITQSEPARPSSSAVVGTQVI